MTDVGNPYDPDEGEVSSGLQVSVCGGMQEQDVRFYVASVVLALKAIHG